jgi:DNA polymerase
VVFARGKLPCDILFIGEAPGVSEDTIGKPFIGPAGKLLDQIISDSILSIPIEEPSVPEPTYLRYALTNLIGCIPADEDGQKTPEPKPVHIHACSPKLVEIISLAKPQAIVFVGKLSKKWGSPLVPSNDIKVETIMHPAAILRSDISSRGLFIQQCVAKLIDLTMELVIPF